MQPQGQHNLHHRGIPNRDSGGFSTTILSPNPTKVPTVTYEYLFCPPSSDQLRPPAQRRAQGLLSGSSTSGTAGCRLQPKILDTTGSLKQKMVGEPYTLYQIWPHHSRLKRRATYLKRTNPGSKLRLHLSTL
jgi:hypothetical protein